MLTEAVISGKSEPAFTTDLGVLEATISDPSPVLAVITSIEKANYRRPGAMMVFTAGGRHVGSLTSGCIEADLAKQASQSRDEGRPRHVTYGTGSPWIDLRLPCGGTLQITLIPNPCRETLTAICVRLRARVPTWIGIGANGEVALDNEHDRSRLISFQVNPDIGFRIFGTGPEALFFALLTSACGYDVSLASPETELFLAASRYGIATTQLVSRSSVEIPDCDLWTSIVLFFHDHDWEPAILRAALRTPAFYLGAQGSRASRLARTEALLSLGASQADIDRIKSPIGLIASVRDARTLAISVLAEIVGDYHQIYGLRLTQKP